MRRRRDEGAKQKYEGEQEGGTKHTSEVSFETKTYRNGRVLNPGGDPRAVVSASKSLRLAGRGTETVGPAGDHSGAQQPLGRSREVHRPRRMGCAFRRRTGENYMRSTTLRRWPGDPWLAWDNAGCVGADRPIEEIAAVMAPRSESGGDETGGSDPSGRRVCRLGWAGAGTVTASVRRVRHALRGAGCDSVPCGSRTASRSVSVGAGAVGTGDDEGPAGAYGVVQAEDGVSPAGRSTTSRATTTPVGARRPGTLKCCNRKRPIRTSRAVVEGRGNRP